MQNIELCYVVQILRISYLIVHRNNIFFGVCADILLLCAEKLPFLGFVQKYYCPGTRGGQDSRAGPFLGYVKKYCFFGEIFTSEAEPCKD